MDFSGYQHPSDIILLAVRYYVSYKLSYRDIEEILAERGSFVDHSTINRWVINFAPMIETKARQIKRPVSSSWRMDETYIKIKGEWWGSVANKVRLVNLIRFPSHGYLS